ncbi:hypothetical protein IEQ34_000789 [Dendrobium chrysotoxum]|uniref:Uncharacterized protein n=1 Tax=Dendrobium chrysotoxum TaxID=161865 RepID=A0AAV7HQU2_DENCH|nr:hypothetical protein IEQ34_000789 [Dendrobium chrysotoxum]
MRISTSSSRLKESVCPHLTRDTIRLPPDRLPSLGSRNFLLDQNHNPTQTVLSSPSDDKLLSYAMNDDG